MATKTKQQPIDLNIVNRATASTYWVTANGVVTPDALADVLEQSTDNASALTQLLPFELFSKKFCLKISELGLEIV